MKGLNAVYFKRYVELFFDVFTQIALLCALFGFMDILIFIKWTTDWDQVEKDYNQKFINGAMGDYNGAPLMNHQFTKGESTPSIIQTMIVMFIKAGNAPATLENRNPQAPIIGSLDDKYQTQGAWMRFMLVVALISVPLMLFVNPCLNSKKASDDENEGLNQVHDEADEKTDQQKQIEALCGDMIIHEHAHTFGEMFIH